MSEFNSGNSGEELFESDSARLFNYKDSKSSNLFSIILVGFLAAGVFAYIYGDRSKQPTQRPYVLYEIKALDPEGHPLAGAKVVVDRAHLGFTDSFGEWRKFVRTSLGTMKTFEITRKIGRKKFRAIKNIAVPGTVARGRDITLRENVTLFESNAQLMATKEVNKTVATAKINKEPKQAILVEKLDPEKTDSPKLELKKNYTSINFSILPSKQNVTKLDSARERFLNGTIKRKLTSFAKSNGLQTTSSSNWNVTLQHISVANAKTGAKGLIEVVSTFDDGTGKFQKNRFLKNYYSKSDKIVSSIFSDLVALSQKSFSAVKTGSRWLVEPTVAERGLWSSKLNGNFEVDGKNIGRLMKLRIQGKSVYELNARASKICEKSAVLNHCIIESQTDTESSKVVQLPGLESNSSVYFSGRLAKALSDDKYEFHGNNAKPVNVTVIKNGKLLSRNTFKYSQLRVQSL
jgi:hypothetical protein